MFKSLKGHQTLYDVGRNPSFTKIPGKKVLVSKGNQMEMVPLGTSSVSSNCVSSCKEQNARSSIAFGIQLSYSWIPWWWFPGQLYVVQESTWWDCCSLCWTKQQKCPPKKAIWVPKKTIDALPISAPLTCRHKEFDRMRICILDTITILMRPKRISMLTLLVMLVRHRVITMLIERNHILLVHLFWIHLQRCGWLRKPNSSAGLCLQVYKMDNGLWMH